MRINTIDILTLTLESLKKEDFKGVLDYLNNLEAATAGKVFEEIAYGLMNTKFKGLYGETFKLKDTPKTLITQLNISTKDIGADLISSKQKQNFIIQSKYKVDTKSLLSRNGDKIASALEQARCSPNTSLLVFTNCYGLSGDIISKMNKNDRFRKDLKTISYTDLLDLSKEDLQNARSFILGLKVVVNRKPLIPEAHQELSIKNTLKELSVADRTYNVFPTGAGKSLMIDKVLESFLNKGTGLFGVFVPSFILAKQTIKDILNNVENKNYKVAVICSDDSVGADLPLYEVPGRTLSSVKEIINEIETQGTENIIFICTYQSSKNLGKALRKTKKFLKLGLIDEAHRTVVGSADKDSTFSQCLYDRHIPMEKRAFYTATPKLVSERLYQRYLDLGRDIPGMSNESLYGKLASSMTFSECVRAKRILNPRLFFSMWTKSDLNKNALYRRFVKNHKGKAIPADLVTAVLILCKVLEESYSYDTGKKTIVYARNNSEARLMKDLFDQIYEGEVFSALITGETSSGERANVFSNFKSSVRGVIFNCKTLVEGVDLPCADTAIFASPKKSVIEIAQAVGRIVRYYLDDPSKQPMIIVPVFHEIEKESDYIKRGAYKDVINTIRALMESNDAVKEYVNKVIEGQDCSEMEFSEDFNVIREGFISLNKFLKNKESLVFKELVFSVKGNTWEKKERLLKLNKKPSRQSKNAQERKDANSLNSYLYEKSLCFDSIFKRRVEKENPILLNANFEELREQTKERLLKLRKKPSAKSKDKKEKNDSKLLVKYLSEKSADFDPVFKRRVEKENPILLVKNRSDSILKNKERLLKLKRKPLINSKNIRERRDYSLINCYTNKKSKYYDPLFTKRVMKENPILLVTKKSSTLKENKERLLKLKTKPTTISSSLQERRDASSLSRYLNEKSAYFDPVFKIRVEKENPILLPAIKQSLMIKNKERLLKLKKKPSYYSDNIQDKKDAKALVRYLSEKSVAFDPVFKRRVEKENPILLVRTNRKLEK